MNGDYQSLLDSNYLLNSIYQMVFSNLLIVKIRNGAEDASHLRSTQAINSDLGSSWLPG